MEVIIIHDNGIKIEKKITSYTIENYKLTLFYNTGEEDFDLNYCKKVIIDKIVIHKKRFFILGIPLRKIIIYMLLILLVLFTLQNVLNKKDNKLESGKTYYKVCKENKGISYPVMQEEPFKLTMKIDLKEWEKLSELQKYRELKKTDNYNKIECIKDEYIKSINIKSGTIDYEK